MYNAMLTLKMLSIFDTPPKKLKDETYSVKVHFIGERFLTFSTLQMNFEVIMKFSEQNCSLLQVSGLRTALSTAVGTHAVTVSQMLCPYLHDERHTGFDDLARIPIHSRGLSNPQSTPANYLSKTAVFVTVEDATLCKRAVDKRTPMAVCPASLLQRTVGVFQRRVVVYDPEWHTTMLNSDEYGFLGPNSVQEILPISTKYTFPLREQFIPPSSSSAGMLGLHNKGMSKAKQTKVARKLYGHHKVYAQKASLAFRRADGAPRI
ncbi:hypothetical protein PISMIDRAFT_637886 [Pisolithus microcarpus 441]|uniref:Unplaced genomic scaffold scaffold_19, whole genome shotgun sequence n=1 Tax=Pisolithus microcarpus 441 TaxID=765257 RepID=A0A0C9ZJS3_9AGAM|nr:hypothetical protein PISMIDRAFT_637886 [Pisolithus microcarpus 441]